MLVFSHILQTVCAELNLQARPPLSMSNHSSSHLHRCGVGVQSFGIRHRDDGFRESLQSFIREFLIRDFALETVEIYAAEERAQPLVGNVWFVPEA